MPCAFVYSRCLPSAVEVPGQSVYVTQRDKTSMRNIFQVVACSSPVSFRSRVLSAVFCTVVYCVVYAIRTVLLATKICTLVIVLPFLVCISSGCICMHVHVRIQAIYEDLLIWLILLACAWLNPALYYFACLHDYNLIFILYKWLDNQRTYWFTFYVFPCLCFCTLFFSCCLLGTCKNSLWLKVPQSDYDPCSLIYSGGMHGSLWHMGCHTNCHIQTCVCGSIHLVQACMYMVHVHVSCSMHYIKSEETGE